jgi:hypothetical protein
MARPVDLGDVDGIETLGDFIFFLSLLRESYRRDAKEVASRIAEGEQYVEGEWTVDSIDGYFDNIEVWLHDWVKAHGEPEESWRGFASILLAGSMYE